MRGKARGKGRTGLSAPPFPITVFWGVAVDAGVSRVQSGAVNGFDCPARRYLGRVSNDQLFTERLTRYPAI